ncbi:hypothetical protein SDC9_125319 [bioreactor metagenome]|uniref:Uncharacterized protein n=1 Tax=bioreactor metagenome TaxID=1076179 RepID=A0A645CN26_9ZZZZ
MGYGYPAAFHFGIRSLSSSCAITIRMLSYGNPSEVTAACQDPMDFQIDKERWGFGASACVN